MGGSQSTTTAKMLEESITKMSTSIVQSCLAETTQNQSLDINNTGTMGSSTFNMNQASTIKSSCFQNSQLQTQLQNQIMSTIEQVAKAQGDALWSAIGASKTSSNTSIKDVINNDVTLSNIQKNYDMIKQSQSTTVNNTGTFQGITVNMSEGASIFSAATNALLNSTGITDAVVAHVAQHSTSITKSPISGLVDLVGKVASAVGTSITEIYIFIAFIIIVIIGSIVYLLSSHATKETPREPRRQLSQHFDRNLNDLSRYGLSKEEVASMT